MLRQRVVFPGLLPEGLLRLARAGEDEPAWSRPALIAVVALTAGLMLIDVTRSGYGNSYYAAGALAASHSWSALFDNAADLGGYVSLDKGPLPDWLMGLSGRLFGFGSFSVMVPNALYGIATVVVLHDAVRRALGHQIAILAALIMALTPVAVLVSRYNAPDALLLLLLVCAAWSLTVAVQSGRMRELLLCAVSVGLAFNTKMLEAYLVAPALALAYLVAGRRSPRRRLRELAVAAGLALLVSVAWFGGMMLVPASDRPYVGDSTDNSWFQLILDGNGIQRVTGSGGAFGRKLESNLLYLFGGHLVGQIAWLLPLALVGLVLGLLTTWSSRRTTFAFGSYALWGAWMLVGCVVLSFSAGTRHAYYTSILAPAVATLAAAALVTLWRSASRSLFAAAGLAIVVVATSWISFAVLADSADFLPWLRWVVLACGALASVAVLAPHVRAAFRRPATMTLAVAAAAVALLAGPAAYSLATAVRAHTGYDPSAGPALGSRRAAVTVTRSDVPMPVATPEFTSSLALLTTYLLAHRAHARFLVAATDAKTAAPIALATGQPVITVGGYTGSDPTPTADQLEQLISSGQLRYVLLDASRVLPTSVVQRDSSAPAWAQRHCSRVPNASIVASATNGTAQPRSRIVPELTLFACGSAA
ncbi:MAG: glycosyltransferase family 39 protein [Solirubrobacteraceae bacterium]